MHKGHPVSRAAMFGYANRCLMVCAPAFRVFNMIDEVNKFSLINSFHNMMRTNQFDGSQWALNMWLGRGHKRPPSFTMVQGCHLWTLQVRRTCTSLPWSWTSSAAEKLARWTILVFAIERTSVEELSCVLLILVFEPYIPWGCWIGLRQRTHPPHANLLAQPEKVCDCVCDVWLFLSMFCNLLCRFLALFGCVFASNYFPFLLCVLLCLFCFQMRLLAVSATILLCMILERCRRYHQQVQWNLLSFSFLLLK